MINFNIHAGGFCIFGRDGVIYDEFGGGDVGCADGLVTRIINEIAADCHAGAIGFFLLGLDRADKTVISTEFSG